MITRRSFLWQMLGAGIWTLLAKWFKGEPTVAEPPVLRNYDLGSGPGRHNWMPLAPREPWESFLMTHEELFWTDGGRVVDYPWAGQGHGLDWSNLQPAEEDVKRMRQLLTDTGCPVNFRINYPCSGNEPEEERNGQDTSL